MKKRYYYTAVVLSVFACLGTSELKAQRTSVGLQAGLGQLIHQPDADGKIKENFSGSSYMLGINLLQPLSKRFSGGLSVQYLRRQFQYDYVSTYASNTYFSDNYKGSYIYFGLSGDVAMGKKHLVHLAITPAYGILAGGSEQLYNGKYANTTGGVVNADSLRTETKDHMAKSDFRIGTQLYLDIPAGKKGFSITPGIAYNFGFNSLNDLHTIHPADLMFRLGVSYSFRNKADRQIVAPGPPPSE